MWKKADFIAGLQRKYKCPVYCAGDVFNFWKPSPWLISMAATYLPLQFYSVYGQHDLPQHNLNLAHKSGLYVLDATDRVAVLGAGHFGEGPCFVNIKDRTVMIWHRLTWTGNVPWPGCTAPTAEELLDEYKSADLILMGDNHKTFVVEGNDGSLLVNPGSLMRQKADQIKHKPCVFLWNADENTVEKVLVPCEPNVISREHIERVKERDTRIDAFVEKLNKEYEVGVSFEDNMREFLDQNTIHSSVEKIIWKAINP